MSQSSIFISYSRKDEAAKDKLLSHLGVLQSAGLISLWSDDRIQAGADWMQEINQAVAQARVAILLITANFLTSDFILGQEVPALLKRRQEAGLIVVPIIATACAWRVVDWLAAMQIRPRSGRPVWSDSGSHVDEDLTEIAEEIAQLIRTDIAEPPPSDSKTASLAESVSVQTLDDRDWDSLLYRIKSGICTPLIGPEVVGKLIQSDRQIALDWAETHAYPLADSDNLPRVAQFLAVKRDLAFPADEIARQLAAGQAGPDLDNPNEPHSFLAGLPLPLYITTNYDNFMLEALRFHNRNPHQEVCRWNRYIPEAQSVFSPNSSIEMSTANPVVYHLYGNVELPESMVLTEDNYLDFLVNISRQPVLPREIEKALVRTSLLFIGYDLTDLRFRILFRGLVTALQRSLRRTSIAVQLAPELSNGEHITEADVRNYLESYMAQDDVRVYWGDSFEFIKELRARWEAYNG